MTDWICYLDLDGVLVDFVGGALNLHNKYIPPDQVQWNFPAQMGFTPQDEHKFWEPLGHDFWANLNWTEEGRGLLISLESLLTPERIVLLTSPCNTKGAVEGKVEWIRKHMPGYSRRFFVGPPKHLLAGPKKILVDDHDVNVDKFIAHGGHASLVPRPWNRCRTLTTDGRFSISDVYQCVASRVNGGL